MRKQATDLYLHISVMPLRASVSTAVYIRRVGLHSIRCWLVPFPSRERSSDCVGKSLSITVPMRLLTYHNPHYRSQHTYQTQFEKYGLRFYFYVK